MTKPTGRPRGRPKTKEYVTLMARVPQDLVDRVQRYAGLHQKSISVVLRDGLELLLEEGRSRPFVSDTKRAPAMLSDTQEERPPLVSGGKTTRSARRAEASAARPVIRSDSQEDASPPVPARPAPPRKARPVPVPPRPLLDPEPAEKDSVEWRRWAVLAQVRAAPVPCTPGDIARQIGATSALVRGDLAYWHQQGRVARHAQGGYVAP